MRATVCPVLDWLRPSDAAHLRITTSPEHCELDPRPTHGPRRQVPPARLSRHPPPQPTTKPITVPGRVSVCYLQYHIRSLVRSIAHTKSYLYHVSGQEMPHFLLIVYCLCARHGLCARARGVP